MRVLGPLLTALGILIGVAVSLAIIAGVPLPGIPWLLAVGLAKVGYLAAGGFIAAGAVVTRLARRDRAQQLLASNGSRPESPSEDERHSHDRLAP
ncbi:MAG: hypothetical protein ACT4P7_01545 [Gemmatimonadaceae bacterium]